MAQREEELPLLGGDRESSSSSYDALLSVPVAAVDRYSEQNSLLVPGPSVPPDIQHTPPVTGLTQPVSVLPGAESTVNGQGGRPRSVSETTGVAVQCTATNTASPYTTSDASGTHPSREQEQPDATNWLQTMKSRAKLKPCLVVSVISILCVIVALASIGIPTVLQAPCKDYLQMVYAYSSDTVLIEPDANNLCNHELSASQVDKNHPDSIEQHVELYTTSCESIKTYWEPLDSTAYSFPDFTGPLSNHENLYGTKGSNVSIVVNASTSPRHASNIHVCMYDNSEYFQQFLTDDWRSYIKNAIFCNVSKISSVEPSLITVLDISFKETNYYFIGLVVENILSTLDVYSYGGRYVYNRTDYTRSNCTLSSESDLPCKLSASGTFPCVLAYARKPVDERRGYSGIQLTSPREFTGTGIATVAVPAGAGVIALAVLLLVVVLFMLYLSNKLWPSPTGATN